MKEKYIPIIPADVPEAYRNDFINNYTAITKGTDRLLLFAGDHKIEHLNTDFYGPTIDADALNPQHLFRIANNQSLGVFATHLGLIARYGHQYPNINYLVKLNGKTNSLAQSKHDPISSTLWSIDEVVQFKKVSGLPIRAIGFTIYIGSAHENSMLAQAAHAIYHAHQQGLVAILWGYSYTASESSTDIGQRAAGIAGVANALGADFVKIKAIDHKYLPLITATAGNTRVICAGGQQIDSATLLRQTHQQLDAGTSAGCAIGRNIFQRSLPQAMAIADALAALIYKNASLQEATALISTEEK